MNRSKRQMMRLGFGCVLGLVLAVSGCAGSSSNGGAHGGLMGLEDGPQKPVWADWHAEASAPGLLPQAFVDEVVAFDYWQIDDPDFREEAWTGAASLLDYLRRGAGEGAGFGEDEARTVTLLLQAFDGRQGDWAEPGGQMDATFVVSLDPSRQVEGVIVRFYAHIDAKEVTPGLAIFLGRTAGYSGASSAGAAEQSAGGFDQAFLWARSGFEEAKSFTMQLKRLGMDDWEVEQRSGLDWSADDFAQAPGAGGSARSGSAQDTRQQSDSGKPGDAGAADQPEELEDIARLTRSIFEQNFWAPLVGSNYIEATLRAEGETALPEDIEPALGLEVRERQVEEIYRDTVFLPHVDIPAQFL